MSKASIPLEKRQKLGLFIHFCFVNLKGEVLGQENKQSGILGVNSSAGVSSSQKFGCFKPSTQQTLVHPRFYFAFCCLSLTSGWRSRNPRWLKQQQQNSLVRLEHTATKSCKYRAILHQPQGKKSSEARDLFQILLSYTPISDTT